MNLLNKKIKDKIKLLDDMDKQYIIPTNSKTQKKNFPKKNGEINIYTNQFQDIKKPKNENFENVYSNFLINGNIIFGNKKQMKKDSINKNNNNENKNDELINSISNGNHESFNNNNNYNNVGKRLNNYGKFIKNKIEIQRKIDNAKRKNAMNINASKTRNKKDNSEQKSYQNNKKITTKSNPKLNNNNTKKLNKSNSNFTYHPKINKRSLLLAKKMEPSSIRLNKKKKINNNNEEDSKLNTFYVNLYKYKQTNSNNQNEKKSSKNKDNNKNKTIYEKMNNLYLRGIEQKEKLKKKYNENHQKKEEDYKKYPFKPKINKIIPYFSAKNKGKKNLSLIINKKSNSKREMKRHDIYEKNFEWKKNIDKENLKKKIANEEKLSKLYTFRPQIDTDKTPKKKKNSKYINKIMEEINDYVNKRKQNIKYKKSEEKYMKKKFFIQNGGYTPRSTIPQEFELKTEIRERNLGKNRNRSCDNFHINQKKVKREQSSGKKSFGENERHSWFFKEEIINKNGGYNNDVNITKETYTHNQFDFIEAVNLLHDKLDKLNI